MLLLSLQERLHCLHNLRACLIRACIFRFCTKGSGGVFFAFFLKCDWTKREWLNWWFFIDHVCRMGKTQADFPPQSEEVNVMVVCFS